MAIYDWPPIYFCSSRDESRAHTQPRLLLKESSLSVQIHLHNSHTLFSTRADHRRFVQEKSPEQGGAQGEGHGGFLEGRSQSREELDVAASRPITGKRTLSHSLVLKPSPAHHAKGCLTPPQGDGTHISYVSLTIAAQPSAVAHSPRRRRCLKPPKPSPSKPSHPNIEVLSSWLKEKRK